MAKRKPEFDLSSEESGDKKQKSIDSKEAKKDENKMLDEILLKDGINFSDITRAIEYYSDMKIISSDKYVLYSHRCEMVKIPLFKTLISECKHESGQCVIELALFDGQTINLMLNFIFNPKSFRYKIVGMNFDKHCRDTFPKLYEIANYISIPGLMNYCREIMEGRIYITKFTIDCYTKHKLNMDDIYDKFVRGFHYDDEIYSDEFLSRVFDYGIVNNVSGILSTLLPIYCPTDVQIEQFTITSQINITDYKGSKQPLIATEGFMDGKVPRRTFVNFLSKYIGKENNPKGVDKFIHKLAKSLFIT